MTTEELEDEMMNNITAAGGVGAALHQAGLDPQPEMDGINVTNAMSVKLRFMKSRYRVTVERIPDDGEHHHD
jgi:hypothetical protein